MPFVHSNKTNLYYKEQGKFNSSPILFGHGLLFNQHIFDQSIQALSNDYHCISYDMRGHGKSATAKGDMSIATLVEDSLQLIQHIAVAPLHFVGHGLSAFIGLEIARKHPSLIHSLTIINPVLQLQPKEKLLYKALSWSLRYISLNQVAQSMINSQFSPRFVERNPQIIPYWKKQFLANSKTELATALRTITNFTCPNIQLPHCPVQLLNSNANLVDKPSYNTALKTTHLLNTGHLLSVEAPFALVQKITQMLPSSDTQKRTFLKQTYS